MGQIFDLASFLKLVVPPRLRRQRQHEAENSGSRKGERMVASTVHSMSMVYKCQRVGRRTSSICSPHLPFFWRPVSVGFTPTLPTQPSSSASKRSFFNTDDSACVTFGCPEDANHFDSGTPVPDPSKSQDLCPNPATEGYPRYQGSTLPEVSRNQFVDPRAVYPNAILDTGKSLPP